MCGEDALFFAKAKYKSGTENEPLCERCMVIDKTIRNDKE